MTGYEPSDRLHARVRAFIRATQAGAEPADGFDAIACELARFQAGAGGPVASMLRARGVDASCLSRVDDIPAVPTDAFKLRRVACHQERDDARVFRTSGTTAGVRGEHAMRTTATYQLAAISWARVMLFPDARKLRVLLLAPPPEAAHDSSLGFMLELFAREIGERSAWFVQEETLRTGLLRDAIAEARRDGAPVLLAGASFAFVHLLDSMQGDRWELPPSSRVMQTGGFKGRSREVDAAKLRRAIASAFGLEPRAVVSEYGMTELSSQAYEGTLRELIGMDSLAGPAGVFFAPPWMRVTAVHPESLAPVANGEEGIARIVDLANVDSAVALQTADRVRSKGPGFELLGRAAGAPPRGCSLGIDEILGGR